MITQEQASEIRQHLIYELNTNGFGDIVTEINSRFQEEYQEEKFERNSRYFLDFFLTQSIEVLENLSNKNYPELINRLNKFTNGEKRIGTINVELLNDGEQVFYDLEKLPSYDKIISSFQEILNEIRKEN